MQVLEPAISELGALKIEHSSVDNFFDLNFTI